MAGEEDKKKKESVLAISSPSPPVKSSLVLFVSPSSKGCFGRHQHDLPDIIFIGKKYDDSGVWVLPQSADDLVVLRLLGLPGDLDRLGDAHATYTRRGEQFAE